MKSNLTLYPCSLVTLCLLHFVNRAILKIKRVTVCSEWNSVAAPLVMKPSLVSLPSRQQFFWNAVCLQEEQAAKLKAEKIRVALEKIKEAQVKKVMCGSLLGLKYLQFFFLFCFASWITLLFIYTVPLVYGKVRMCAPCYLSHEGLWGDVYDSLCLWAGLKGLT